jgi:phosphoglycolate phosphatase
LSRIQAVILDFDGVIAESNEVKNGAFSQFFARYPEHAEAMRAFHEEHHARPRRFKFTHYVECLMHRPGDTEAVDRMAAEFSALVMDRVIQCPEVPGASDFFREFSARVPLYISSVTPQDELEGIVKARGVDRYVKAVFGDPPNAKVQAVEQILSREDLRSEQVAFVGDSRSDFLVAQQTGLFFIARDSGQIFPDEVRKRCVDLGEVADVLRPMTV